MPLSVVSGALSIPRDSNRYWTSNSPALPICCGVSAVAKGYHRRRFPSPQKIQFFSANVMAATGRAVPTATAYSTQIAITHALGKPHAFLFTPCVTCYLSTSGRLSNKYTFQTTPQTPPTIMTAIQDVFPIPIRRPAIIFGIPHPKFRK